MNTRSIYLLLFILVLASCRKTDPTLQQSQYAAPQIDSIDVAGFPGTGWTVRTDTFPHIVTNTVNLPYAASIDQINLDIHTKNTTVVQVYDSITGNRTFLPDPASGTVEAAVNGNKPVYIKLFDHNAEVDYILRIKKNQLPDPDFSGLAFSLNPNGLTPLAGILSVSSSEPVSVKYTVKGQDGEDYISRNTLLATDYKLNLFGLYPNTKNTINVIITNAEGSMASRDIYVTTAELPEEFPPASDITVNKLDTANAQTRFVLFYPYKTVGGLPFKSPTGNMAYPIVLDRHGKVRWYMTTPYVLDMKPMPNGHFLLYYYGYIFREVDLMGNIYKEINPPVICHHDFQLLPNGNILYTGTDLSVNNTIEDKIYEINYQTGATVKTINLYDILDPSRQQQPFINSDDWFHNNSLAYDSTDNSIIVTGRDQSTICKIDYASNRIKWIISSPDYWKAPWSNYLLQPAGSDFEYTWGQHCVVLNPQDHNKLIVFDNGNERSYSNPFSPANSYSRLVEFSIDPSAKTVSQSFAFGKQMGSENYSPALGSVDYIKQNLFICFPLIVKDANGIAANTGTPSIRFMETDRNSNVLFDMRIKDNTGIAGNGYHTYRAHPFNFN